MQAKCNSARRHYRVRVDQRATKCDRNFRPEPLNGSTETACIKSPADGESIGTEAAGGTPIPDVSPSEAVCTAMFGIELDRLIAGPSNSTPFADYTIFHVGPFLSSWKIRHVANAERISASDMRTAMFEMIMNMHYI